MALTATISALLAGRTVRVLHLVEICFRTQARRIHNGHYKIVALGHDWFGGMKLGGIDGLATDGDLQAAELRFTVSGADARFLAVATGPRTEYVGVHAKVYLQFLDPSTSELLDDPIARAAGIIDGLEIGRAPMEGGGTRRVITVTATNMFYSRSAPPASYFTSMDQQQRFPGDRGLAYLSELPNKNIPFPW